LGEKSQIVTGDALSVLRRISDNYIDCCVTSPPYYGLRDYGEAGQIGLEKSVDEYIYNLVGVFREVRRALRPDGTLWINIADTYSQSKKLGGYIKKKELCLVPYRLMLELQKDGWYVRQDIIWNKPNAMPESVRDRCTKSHEYIFLLSKSEKYHFDYEAIREPAVGFDSGQQRGRNAELTQEKRKCKDVQRRRCLYRRTELQELGADGKRKPREYGK
jgi:DNA modification methylase